VSKPRPDWFWSLSGGIDSTAAFLLTREAIEANYRKRPIAIYLDTRIGVPLQLLYTQELCDRFDVQLWTLRTHEKYEDRVEREGHPGSGMHGYVQNELKGRQRAKLNALADDAVYVTGIRADESPERAKYPKTERRDDCSYVKPVFEFTKQKCAELIAAHPDCPINPLWLEPHFGDCGCGANGDPGELIDLEANFPWFAQRLREIEESAQFNDETATWGWGGLNKREKQALRAVNDDGQLSPCGPSCSQRQLDQEIVQTFRDRVRGDRDFGGVREVLASDE